MSNQVGRGVAHSIDPTVLASLRRIGGESQQGRDALARLVEVFLSDASSRLRALAVAADDEHWDEIAQHSQRVGASSSTFGAHVVADRCRAIDTAAASRDASTIRSLVADASEAFAAADEVLRRELVADTGARTPTRRARVAPWSADLAHQTLSLSADAATMFGLVAGDPVPTLPDLHRWVHPRDLEAWQRFAADVITTGRASAVLSFVCPDASVRTFHVQAARGDGRSASPMQVRGTVSEPNDTGRPDPDAGELDRSTPRGFGRSGAAGTAEVGRRDVASIGSADDASLDAAIEHALGHGEFRLHYQPKVSLVTNRIVGFEALVRWDRPGLGIVGPSEFIPRAEVTGQVVALGGWVMHEACRQIVAWQRAFITIPLTIHINISPQQFREDLADVVRGAVTATGVDPRTISLELTETAVMDDLATSLRVFETVRHLGVRFSVDDFGVGYSSLNHLRRMPVDEIKIDRSFIDALEHSSVDTAIVASIISLAHAMGADAVCDGVETLDQLERLRALGADAAQGYVFAPPLPAGEVDDMLAADAMGERWPRPPKGVDGGKPSAREAVLIVHDAADVRRLAAIALTPAGFGCHEVGSATSGIAMARRLHPDCVLIDVNLPDANGVEVCRTLRNDPATKDCTIVMLTSADRGSTKAEAFLFGADDYIVQPFSPRELTARIRAAQRRRRAMAKAEPGAHLALMELVRARQDADAAADELTSVDSEGLSDRQLEIVERLLRGDRVPTIAKSLYLSQSTVRNHLSVVFRKFGVTSQEELLLRLRSKDATP